MTPLEKSIISTISYFDIFDYPLTVMEIWKWLYVDDNQPAVDLAAVQQALEQSEYLRQRIAGQDGFYFLQGRAGIVQTRHERYSLAEQKYHKAKRMIRILRWVPFIKMIGVCNTLSYNNSRADADIDLFIVTQRHRIWQSRWWVTGFLKLFGLRPSPGRTRNKICSSFFIDEDHLDLQKVALAHDMHFAYWAMQIVPVYDEGVYPAFFAANDWARVQLPHVGQIIPSTRRTVPPAGAVKSVLRVCCSIFPERLFRWMQMNIMPAALKQAANRDTRVVVNDGMLKFHDNDRRQFFFTRWQRRLQEVL
jgi:hypothetical protein